MSKVLLSESLALVIQALAFLMLLLALSIATAKTVRLMIPLYQIQSLLLVVITLLTAWQPMAGRIQFSVAIFVVIPLLLVFLINPLLAQATVPEDLPLLERLRRLLPGCLPQETRLRVTPIWLQRRAGKSSDTLLLFLVLGLIVLAYLLAFGLQATNPGQANNLAVLLSLLLLGQFIMIKNRDLVTQVMGLLVMEHGMFLAAVQGSTLPTVASTLVIGLFLYIFITLTLLVLLLPELHRVSDSIEIQDQETLKG